LRPVAKPDLVDSPIWRGCTPTLFPATLGLHPSETCLVRAQAVRAIIVSDEPSHKEFKDRIEKAEDLCRAGKPEEAEKMLASFEQDLQTGGTKQ
jgi:ABC-type hemin transport system substrate-binding protein